MEKGQLPRYWYYLASVKQKYISQEIRNSAAAGYDIDVAADFHEFYQCCTSETIRHILSDTDIGARKATKKRDMIQRLHDGFQDPAVLSRTLCALSPQAYGAAVSLAKKKGGQRIRDRQRMLISGALGNLGLSILFQEDDGYTDVMVDELRHWVVRLEKNEAFRIRRQRCTAMYRRVLALLYLYGVLDTLDTDQMMWEQSFAAYYGKNIDGRFGKEGPLPAQGDMEFAIDYCNCLKLFRSFGRESTLLYYPGITRPQELFDYIQTRDDLQQISATKELLLQAETPPLAAEQLYEEAFRITVGKYLADDADDLEALVENTRMLIKAVGPENSLMDYVFSNCTIDNVEQANELAGVVARWSNSVPHWSLKGHIPRELYVEQHQPRKRAEQKGERTGKVGRNAPCPCERGKKYKDCCGKVIPFPTKGRPD